MIGAFRFNFVLAVICVIFIENIPKTESVIRCYKCLPTLPPIFSSDTVNLCKDFDYSEKFVVDCPQSTFCMERFTSAKIPTAINGTERGCASQTHVIQNLKNGHWQKEVQMEEPYKSGCHKVDDKGLRTTIIENCYCDTDLCNADPKLCNPEHGMCSSAETYMNFGLAGSLMAVIIFIVF